MQYCANFIKEILALHGKTLKRSLGQNFLFDEKILQNITNAAVGDTSPNIVEIGAGVGLLTNLLCKKGKKVVTVEIDKTLPPILKETVPQANFSLFLNDILKTDLAALGEQYFGGEKFVVVGNLPYYITAKILNKLMADISLFERAVIMVQKDVADRLRSAPGSKEYRAGALQAQALFDIEYVCTVPPHSFVPAPHIDSAVITLTPKKDPLVKPIDIPAFLRFTDAAFLSRRKQLKSVAKSLNTTPQQMAQSLAALDLPVSARAESLTPKQMVKLFYSLT